MVMQNIGGANKMQDGLCENRELGQCDSNMSIDVNPRSQINPRQRVLQVQFWWFHRCLAANKLINFEGYYSFFVIEIDPTGNNRCKLPCKKWAIPHLFERLFLISWENNRDCHLTMPLSLKTMEVQIKGDHWNKRLRTVQVYCKKLPNAFTFKSVTDFFYTIR